MDQQTSPIVQSQIVESTLEVVINRPDALNALNMAVLEGLHSLFARDRTKGVRCVIITGAGEKAFVAGADVAAMSAMSSDEIHQYINFGQRVMRAIESYPLPVIAAVNGFALGGGLELALACDLIVASEKARIGQPEVNLGIIPGFGGTQRLLRRCGIGVARRLCLLGEILPAAEAHALGIVDKVVAPTDLMKDARAWAALIGSKGPNAVRGAKRVLREAEDTQLLPGLTLEQNEFLRLFAGEERVEGMKAFLEKRSPRFSIE